MIGDTQKQLSGFFVKNQIFLLRALSFISLIFFSYATYKGLTSSLWRDEAFTALLVQKNFGDVITLMMQDTNTPLHPLLVYGVIHIFGQSDLTMRLISLLAILGTVFILRKLVSKSETKELVTILFFISVHAFFYATEARYYGLFMFTTLWSFYQTKQLVKHRNRMNIFLYILANILVIYSQTLGIIVFGSNALVYLYLYYRKKSLTRQVLYRWIGLHTIIFLFFAPWILIILQQMKTIQSTGFWLTFDSTRSLTDAMVALFYDKLNYFDLGLLVLSGICAYAFAFFNGAKHAFNNKKYLYLLAFLVPFIIIYLLSFKQPLFYIRYLVFLVPFVIIIAAKGISLYKPVNQILVCFLIICAYTTAFQANYPEDMRSPFKKVAQQVKEVNTVNTVFLNDQEYSYFQCEYYLQNCYILKNYKDINGNVGISLIPEQVTLSEEQVVHYLENGVFDRIGIVFYGNSYPKYDFLENYHLVIEKRVSGNNDDLSILVYEKNSPN